MDQATRGFAHRLEGGPDFSFLTVKIPKGKTLKVEASAMASMDSHMKMKTKLKGGFSRFLTGESLFINEFTAEQADAEMSIAPGAPGDMKHVYLDNQTIYLQSAAYVASSPEIELQTKWQGITKGFFSGESFFLIKASGTGDLWFNTFGSMIELTDPDASITVDTGHIVAFTEGLDYDISRLGGYKSLFFSGEGLVCKFRGQGRVWIQTRKFSPFAYWIYAYRPERKKSDD